MPSAAAAELIGAQNCTESRREPRSFLRYMEPDEAQTPRSGHAGKLGGDAVHGARFCCSPAAVVEIPRTADRNRPEKPQINSKAHSVRCTAFCYGAVTFTMKHRRRAVRLIPAGFFTRLGVSFDFGQFLDTLRGYFFSFIIQLVIR